MVGSVHVGGLFLAPSDSSRGTDCAEDAEEEREPLVSIVMPVHNGMPYLSDALASLAAQVQALPPPSHVPLIWESIFRQAWAPLR